MNSPMSVNVPKKSMIRNLKPPRASIILILCVGLVLSSNAQKIGSQKLHQEKIHLTKVERISVDRLGGFYLSSSCGIEKFDPNGVAKEKYHLRNCTSVEVLECWNPFRMYAFQKSTRSFRVYDQYLTVSEEMAIDSAVAIAPLLATPANDNRSYWLLDSDYSIKKIDFRTNKVLFESEPIVDPTGTFHFVHMREFQNFIFLMDEKEGLFVLNNVGRFVKKIDSRGATYFSVLGEDIYFLKDNKVHFFDIFTEEIYTIEVPQNTRFVIATDEKITLIKDKTLEVYAFTPRQ
jgi:hypothetical protein